MQQWDHKTLPDDMNWGEDIARAVGTLANCVEVEVRRPLERFYARFICSRALGEQANGEGAEQ